METQFNVGDIITGKDGCHNFYGVTNEFAQLEVVEISGSGNYIQLKVLDHTNMHNQIGNVYSISNFNKFKMVTPKLPEVTFEQTTNKRKEDGLYITQIFNNEFKDVCKDDSELYGYIEVMAKSLEKDITNRDLKEIFPYNKSNKLTCNENEITEILLKLEDIKKEEFNFSELQKENIIKSSENFYNKQKDNIQSDLNALKSTLSRKMQEVDEYMSQIVDKRKEYENMTDNVSGQMLERLKGVDASKWNLCKIQGDYIYFTTKEEIVLTHIKKAAGINLRMNFGKFKVSVNMKIMNLEIKEYKGNFTSDDEGYYHPHVDSCGDVCWGNLNNLRLEACENLDYGKLLEACYLLLTTYNDNSPYLSLAEFCQESGQIQPNGEYVEEEESRIYIYYFTCSDCEHTYDSINDSGLSYDSERCPECGTHNDSHDWEVYG